ncbi:MAG: RsmD family RNA methyltransferase [Bacteroidota bacterium]
MRVISGEFGGRPIKVPGNLPVRPTTDRTREALFNHLYHTFTLEDAQVLDLFSGTGSIMLEFLSRGSAHVTAVDKHRNCIRALRQHEKNFGLKGRITIHQQDVFRFLALDTATYDLIFADPPYDMPNQEHLVDLAINRLKEGGCFMLEHRSQFSFDHHPAYDNTRKYGSSSLSFFDPPTT